MQIMKFVHISEVHLLSPLLGLARRSVEVEEVDSAGHPFVQAAAATIAIPLITTDDAPIVKESFQKLRNGINKVHAALSPHGILGVDVFQ